MAVLRTTFRIAAGVVVGLVVLAVALLVVTAVINRHDEPPSESTRRFTELYSSWPSVPDELNGYVDTMGFHVATGEDVRAMGLRRVAWLREVVAGRPFAENDDPARSTASIVRTRPTEVEEFVEICGEDTRECVAAFANASSIVESWAAAETQLLPRYLALLSRPGWHDEFPDDVSWPLPRFGEVIDGQRLLLLSAYVAAERGDVDEVRERLEADLQFWRRVLESTDMLITKMVATNALKRHFEWGNLVLRRLPAGTAAAALPTGWRQELTEPERSMLRCLTGEWLFVSKLLRRFDPEAVLAADATWLERARTPLLERFYQRQDTINRYADYYWILSEVFDAPLEDYEAALGRATALRRETADNAFRRTLYNLGGGVHLVQASDFSQYAARVADIEGVRRAALAAATLRDAAVGTTDVAAALRTSELRNPYDGAPLEWNASDEAIVFRGLEITERGEHRLHY